MENNNTQYDNFDSIIKEAFSWRYHKLLPILMDALQKLEKAEYRVLFLLYEEHKDKQQIAKILKKNLEEIEKIEHDAYKIIHNFLSEKGLGEVFDLEFIPDLIEDSAEMPELFSDSYYILGEEETFYSVVKNEANQIKQSILKYLPKFDEVPEVFASVISLLDLDQKENFALYSLAASNEAVRPWVIQMETGDQDFEAVLFRNEGRTTLGIVCVKDPGEISVKLYLNESDEPITARLKFTKIVDDQFLAQFTVAINYRPSFYKLRIE